MFVLTIQRYTRSLAGFAGIGHDYEGVIAMVGAEQDAWAWAAFTLDSARCVEVSAIGGRGRVYRLRVEPGGTPHHFASSIFVFFLVRDRLFRSTDPGAWHTRHRHWDVEWVEGLSADDGMSPKALASLGSRSPRTVSHGRQPALRVLRCAPVLRMTAATDRARSPCGPAGKAGPRSTACKCDACEPLMCRWKQLLVQAHVSLEETPMPDQPHMLQYAGKSALSRHDQGRTSSGGP